MLQTDCLSLNWMSKNGEMASLADTLRHYPTTHYEYGTSYNGIFRLVTARASTFLIMLWTAGPTLCLPPASAPT